MKCSPLAIPVALLVLGSLTACTTGNSAPNATRTPTSAQASLSPTQQADQAIAQAKKDAKDAKKSLEALPANPQKYLSEDALQQLRDGGSSPAAAFPAGSKITADESSWHAVGAGEGLMDTTFIKPDGTEEKYVAAMIKKQGTWQLLYTTAATS